MKTLRFVSFNPVSEIIMRRAQRLLVAFLFCGLAMLLPMSVRAAIALQDGPVGITNSPTTSTNLSMPFTVTSGAQVLVVTLLDKVSTSGGVAPTTLSWNGQTLTRAVNTFDTASIYREASIYYLFNPTTDGLSHNITGSLKPTTVTVSLIQAFTLNGVDTNVPPVIGAANSTSGTSSYLSFNVTVAANSWAAVGGILGSTIPAGSAVSGTGGTAVITTTNAANNTAFSFGYISGLSAGSDTISYSWTLPASPNPTANAVGHCTVDISHHDGVVPAISNCCWGNRLSMAQQQCAAGGGRRISRSLMVPALPTWSLERIIAWWHPATTAQLPVPW